MPLKVLMNCSPVVQGGAMQVTQSILTEASRDSRIEYRIIGTSQLKAALDKANVKLAHYETLNQTSPWKRYFEANKVLARHEAEFKPDICYSVYGPTTWKPSKPHFVGFAYGHFIYPELDPYAQIPFVPRMVLQAKDVLRKRYVSNADAWFVQTRVVADRLSEIFKLPRQQVHVISNTYSTAFKERLTKQTTARPNDEYFRILVPGAYYPHKNLVLVPKLAKELQGKQLPKKPRFQFTIPVDHPGWQEIRSLASSLGLPDEQFETLGTIPNAVFADAYYQADMVFLPTLLECSTAVYPESFAAERPLSTSNRDFARELCGDAAVFFDPFSPTQAADAVYRIMTDEALRADLVEKGRKQLVTGYWTPAQRWQAIYGHLSSAAKG